VLPDFLISFWELNSSNDIFFRSMIGYL
jgi:hypothetical protein